MATGVLGATAVARLIALRLAGAPAPPAAPPPAFAIGIGPVTGPGTGLPAG
jgi:hypothetical protein